MAPYSHMIPDPDPLGCVHYELSQPGFETFRCDDPYSIAGPMGWPALNVITVRGDTVYIAHFPARSGEDAEGAAEFLHAVTKGRRAALGQETALRLAPEAVATLLRQAGELEGLRQLREVYDANGSVTLVWWPAKDPDYVAITGDGPDIVLRTDRVPCNADIVLAPEYAESPAKQAERRARAAHIAEGICRGPSYTPPVSVLKRPPPGFPLS